MMKSKVFNTCQAGSGHSFARVLERVGPDCVAASAGSLERMLFYSLSIFINFLRDERSFFYK